MAASKSQRGSSSGRRSHRAINDQATTNIINTSSTDTSSITNRRGSVDGVMQRCGLCSLLSSLLRRAMCVGSRRGSGESYYQELAETAVSFPINIRTLVYLFFISFPSPNVLFLFIFLTFFITSFALLTSIEISIWCSIPDFYFPKYTAKSMQQKKGFKINNSTQQMVENLL